MGQNIVFGSGQYLKDISRSQRLIAHELTHVVQQEGYSLNSLPINGRRSEHRFVSVQVQRQPEKDSKKRAEAIIAKAKDPKLPLRTRAIEAVNSIIKEYYDASMISEVVYDENEEGLATEPIGKGKDIKGKITVGKYFIEHIDSFARRVLQVGHEVQHTKQQREGMGGKENKDKREFLAFYWEGLATEKLGTGKMPDATRRVLIDAALGYFYCLSQDEKKAFASKQEELLNRRKTVNGTHGNASAQPPNECKRK